MPSFSHEFLVELFRAAPSWARELLKRASATELPDGIDELGSIDLSQVTSPEYAADAVIKVRAGTQIVAAIVVEVQLHEDPDKLFTWPVYLAVVRRQLGCSVWLLVIAGDDRVAAWARRPIALGPGYKLEPTVIGPSQVPSITDLDAARRLPQLSILSTLARPEMDVVRTSLAMVATPGLLSQALLDVRTINSHRCPHGGVVGVAAVRRPSAGICGPRREGPRRG